MNILALNRFFETNPEKKEDARTRIGNFVNRVLQIPEITELHVAVNPADRSGALTFLRDWEWKHDRLKAYTVDPWGKFVPALNAALEYSREGDFDALLCISTEMHVTAEQVQALAAELNENTLVVGARLKGHAFDPGVRAVTGRTVPWNTFALWNMKLLREGGGFPHIGEAYWSPKGDDAGVEEVGTIALHQCIHNVHAVLKEVPGIEWRTESLDAARKKKHDAKMASKVERPAAQIAKADLHPGIVTHIS